VARVVFVRTGLVVDAPDGARVVDLCDDNIFAGVRFACRHANCGICRVIVEEGAAHCAPAEDDELQLTETVFGHGPEVRLACQLRVLPGDGTVRLRVWV
jgi:ferredoxin